MMEQLKHMPSDTIDNDTGQSITDTADRTDPAHAGPGRTELVFVVDRSGSMSGLESDTIGGFNAMLAKQRAIAGECTVTTVRGGISLEAASATAVFRDVREDYRSRGRSRRQ